MQSEVQTQIPCYYVRYEDLILDPEPVLKELFKFMLGADNIEGTVIEKRIQDYVAQGFSKAKVYNLKTDPSKNLNRNIGAYTTAQKEWLKENCREFNYFFNYSSHPEEGVADPATVFFDYSEFDGAQHDEEKLAKNFGGYLKKNAEVMSRVTQPTMTSFTFNRTFPVEPDCSDLGQPQAKLEIKE